MRYFFNVAGAINNPDDEGLELPTARQARMTAVHFASEMIRDFPDAILAGEELRIEVEDREHAPLLTISVRSANSAPIGTTAWD